MPDVHCQTILCCILASLHAQSWSVVGAVVLPSLGSLFHASLLYSWVHIYLPLGFPVRFASLADHYLLSSETAANKQSATEQTVLVVLARKKGATKEKIESRHAL